MEIIKFNKEIFLKGKPFTRTSYDCILHMAGPKGGAV